MVIFVITREGFKELETIIKTAQYPVWISANILSKEELDLVRSLGVEITNFTYDISIQDINSINEALSTISEHHPHKRIWLEHLV